MILLHYDMVLQNKTKKLVLLNVHVTVFTDDVHSTLPFSF